MESGTAWRKACERVGCTIALLATCLLATACYQSSAGQAAPGVASPVIPTQIPVAISTLPGPQLDATKVAIIEAPEHELQTRIAGGITPVVTYVVIPTTGPVPTPVLGISGDCAQGNHIYDFGGCWTGVINGEFLLVDTGTRHSEPEQGYLRVHTSTLDLRTDGSVHWYSTPSKAGLIKPTQITWPRLTVVTTRTNPQVTFVFDLVTRQWVNP